MGLKKKPEKENLPASTPIRVDDDDDSGDAHGGGAMEGSFSTNANLTSLPPAANINDPIQFGTTMGFNDTPMTSGEDPPITTSSINNTNVTITTNDCNMTNSDSVVNQDDDMESLVNILQELDVSKKDVQPVDAQFSSPKNTDKRLETVGRGRIREALQKNSRTTKLNTQEIAGDISELRSEASGSGTSTFLANDDAVPAMRRSSGRHDPSSSSNSWALVGQTSSTYNQMYLPPGFHAQNVAGQTPNIAAGNMPPGFIYSYIPMVCGRCGNIRWHVYQIFFSPQLYIPPVGGYQDPNVWHPMSFPIGQGIPSANVVVVIPGASNIQSQPLPLGRRVRRHPRRPIASAPPELPTVIELDSDSIPPSLESTDSDSTPSSPDSSPLREPSLQPSGEQC